MGATQDDLVAVLDGEFDLVHLVLKLQSFGQKLQDLRVKKKEAAEKEDAVHSQWPDWAPMGPIGPIGPKLGPGLNLALLIFSVPGMFWHPLGLLGHSRSFWDFRVGTKC